MRILQLHARYRHTGGEDVVVEAEGSALRNAGHDVLAHISHNPVERSSALGSLAASPWNAAAARRVGDVARQFRPDVAHVHNTWFASSPSVIWELRRAGVPVVMTVHNYRLACVNALLLRDAAPCESCLDHGVLEGVRHGCYRSSRALSAVATTSLVLHRRLGTWTRAVDRFLVLNEFARTRLERAGLPAERMTVAGNFVPDPGPRPAAPSRSGDVLFVGRISAEKGLNVLLNAWERARPEGLRLVVVGDGPQRRELDGRNCGSVEFLGRLAPDAVTDRLVRARALAIPSVWYEGQPLVALEALAAGTPTITSDIGGLPAIAGDRSTGWRFRPGDVAELADRLWALSEDREVDSRGAAARRRYREAFTPDVAVPRLEAVYTDVIGARAA